MAQKYLNFIECRFSVKKCFGGKTALFRVDAVVFQEISKWVFQCEKKYVVLT